MCNLINFAVESDADKMFEIFFVFYYGFVFRNMGSFCFSFTKNGKNHGKHIKQNVVGLLKLY